MSHSLNKIWIHAIWATKIFISKQPDVFNQPTILIHQSISIWQPTNLFVGIMNNQIIQNRFNGFIKHTH